MTTVVIGGHSRNIGKTSVMAGLIRSLHPPRWAAVKITQYGHGVCSLDSEPCACDPGEHAFVLTEERERTGRGDTRRFLQAGARRSLWLRVRHGQLPRAFPALMRALEGEEWVMVESNSILELMEPALYLFVLDPAQIDFKSSAAKFIDRADALVAIGRAAHGGYPWPQINADVLTRKPLFRQLTLKDASDELVEFVRQRLGLPAAVRSAEGE